MFDLYTLICCLSFILLIVWFLFTEHEEDERPAVEPHVPRPKKKQTPPTAAVIKEVIDECVGAVDDAVALQEELDTEKEKLLQTIRRRLKPSGASKAEGSTPV